MLTIKIENLDKLYELFLKLSMLTFLQGLIVTDDYIDYGEGFEFVFNYAREFLYQEEKQIMLELNSLINSENFTEKIN